MSETKDPTPTTDPPHSGPGLRGCPICGRINGHDHDVDPTPTTERECDARCGGILGHAGHHQTDDYDEIVAEAREQGWKHGRSQGLNEMLAEMPTRTYQEGHADALREAAERVRALPVHKWCEAMVPIGFEALSRGAVLAILTETER